MKKVTVELHKLTFRVLCESAGGEFAGSELEMNAQAIPDEIRGDLVRLIGVAWAKKVDLSTSDVLIEEQLDAS